MLEIRPNCENCGTALPPNSLDAMICSFECTFCRTCVTGVLDNVCPNCGGGLCPRPIRPARDWHGGNHLGAAPASTKAVLKPVDRDKHAVLVKALKGIPPERR